MNEIITGLSELSARRAASLAAEKAAGKPLVEYSSTFIPEELIRAAGANTYLLCSGGRQEAVDAAMDDMLRCMNPLALATAGSIKLGRDEVTPHADLLVTAVTDCHIGRMSELLEYRGVNTFKVGVPSDWRKPIAFEYYVRALRRMMEAVEGITGKAVDEELAREGFAQSNRINACFRRINKLRCRPDAPITFCDYMRLQHMSFMLGDAQLAADRLEEICSMLEDAPGAYCAGSPRLLLVGRAIAVGDYPLIELLDKCGAAVVAEMLDDCIRVTEKDVELEGDLLLNFARNRYLERTPVDSFQPSWHMRFRRMKELIEEYAIDGVVWYQLANDEIYDMEYTCVENWLRELGMPLMRLETSYSYTRETLGQAVAQIESFVERLCRD